MTQPEFIFKNINLGSFDEPQVKQNGMESVNDHNSTLNETNVDGGMCDLNSTMLQNKTQLENTTCKSIFVMEKLKDTEQDYIGYILITAYGLSQGLTIYLIRGTTINDASYDVQLLWSHVVGFLVSLVLMLIFETPTLPNNIYNALYLTGHVIFSFLATVTYFIALNFASGVLVTLNYSFGIVLSMLSQYFIVRNVHSGHRNLMEIGGALLVLLAACINPVHYLIKEKLIDYRMVNKKDPDLS